MTAPRLLLVALLALACGAEEPACVEGASCGDRGVCASGACLRTVVGTMQLVRLTGAGEVPVGPVDLTALRVRAFSCGGAGCVEHPGAGRADGTFEIPAVPMGSYLLDVGDPAAAPSFEEHESTTVALTTPSWPNADLVSPAPGTAVTWSLDGLSPWEPESSRIELVSAGIEYGRRWGPMPEQGGPAAGEVAVTFELTPWGLVDGARGDRVIVTQLGAAGSAELPYLRIVRAVELAPTFTDGVAQEIRATLAPAPAPVASLAVDWAPAEFEALAPEIPVSASAGGGFATLSVGARPHDAWASDAPTLLEAWIAAEPSPGRLTATLAHADPFPVAWRRHAVATMSWTFPLDFPSPASERRWMTAEVQAWQDVDALGAVSLAPAVGPIRAPRIAGQDAMGMPTGVGATPKFSWSIPSVGLPLHYSLSIFLVPGQGQQRRVASFHTPGTAVTVPPGVLEQGRLYYARISAAAADGGASLITAPFVP